MNLRNLVAALLIAMLTPICLSETDPPSVINTAYMLVGSPKKLGGTTPSGFDCSGLMRYLFLQHGILLPRRAIEQSRFGEEVHVPEPGDLLLFGNKRAQHVALFIGHGQMVHVSYSKKKVVVTEMNGYWEKRLIGVRRLLKNPSTIPAIEEWKESS